MNLLRKYSSPTMYGRFLNRPYVSPNRKANALQGVGFSFGLFVCLFVFFFPSSEVGDQPDLTYSNQTARISVAFRFRYTEVIESNLLYTLHFQVSIDLWQDF